MRFLFDENIPYQTYKLTSEAGFEVDSIALNHPSVSDKKVIEIARQKNQIIITLDSDFGELIFREKLAPPPGLIYLRFKSFTPDFLFENLKLLLENHQEGIEGYMSVIDQNGIRKRKL